jgi:aspartate/methionine/tyrosine aminotransferase
MFSTRFKWEFERNRLSILLNEKKQAGSEILDLTESNPTRAGFNYAEAEILRALSTPEVMKYWPEPRGVMTAREAVVRYYEDGGIELTADSIHLTSSTSEAYAFLFKLVADPGDEVLIPEPGYPLFEFLAALEGVELRPYRLSYSHPRGWRLDFDSLIEAITSRTRAVITVNPNNPTGSFIGEDRERLLRVCSEKRIALISDEVFADYSWAGLPLSQTSLANQDQALTFVLSGLSKIAALPQMKLGWIVARGLQPALKDAQDRLELIADTYLSVGTPVQAALPEMLATRGKVQRDIKSRVKMNLEELTRFVEGTALRLLQAQGGWYATVEIPRHHSEEEWVLKLLAEANVLIHPGYFFNFDREAFLVFSLLTKEAVFGEALTRIRRILQ